MSSNCLVFNTSGGISSSPAAFLFSIFLNNESSSSRENDLSLMSKCILVILVIGSCVISGGFSCRFSKCFFPQFYSFLLVCSFQFSFGCPLLSAHFVYLLPRYPRFYYFRYMLSNSFCAFMS